jgi:hypothetical protein
MTDCHIKALRASSVEMEPEGRVMALWRVILERGGVEGEVGPGAFWRGRWC